MSIEQIETGSCPQDTTVEQSPQQLRLLSWNIARGVRLSAIADFLTSSSPDLILLQEVDQNCRRTGYLNIAKELSQALRMNYVFGTEFQELSQGSRAYHGQAILSRWQLSRSRLLRFRHQSTFWNPSWYAPNISFLQRRVGGRMALVTEVGVPGSTLAVYNLHLESRNGNDLRNSQLGELLEDAKQYDGEILVIAGGDFNLDLRGKDESRAIRDAGFNNAFTDGDSRTTVRDFLGHQKMIDTVLTRGKLTTIAAEIHCEVEGSDHYPLSMTVRFSA